MYTVVQRISKNLSEKFYNNSGEQEMAVSYTYNINVPFPIITKYDSSKGEGLCILKVSILLEIITAFICTKITRTSMMATVSFLAWILMQGCF